MTALRSILVLAPTLVALPAWPASAAAGKEEPPVQTIGPCTAVQPVDGDAILRCENGVVRLRFCRPDMVRVRMSRSGTFPPNEPYMVARYDWPVVKSACKKTQHGWRIATERMAIDVTSRPALTLTITDQTRPRCRIEQIPTEPMGWQDKRVFLTQRLTEGERVFGFGLQFHRFDHRETKKYIRVTADAPPGGQSHVPIPFYISACGYGLLLHTAFASRFDVGATKNDRCRIEAPGDELDYYVMLGKPAEITHLYAELTGRPAMPPLWGLGVWYRGKSEWNQAKMESIAAEFRKRQIPCDVYGLEPKWQTGAYPCTYVWNAKTFPDPPAFLRRMTELGFKVNLWEHAFIRKTSPIAETIKPYCSPNGRGFGGLVPDFTLPEARKIFFSIHKREHLDIGVAAYKLDECDGADFTGKWFFYDRSRFPSGKTGAEMHNLFGLLYQMTMHEGIRRTTGRRTLFLCRGNYIGGQRYPTAAYSDTYVLKDYIRAVANSAFTQHLWCPEIRGGSEFQRRLRLMMFSAIAQDNEWSKGTMPWQHGAEAEKVFRHYARLRMRLLPYLYSHAWLGHRTGVGLIRALVMEHPDDPATYDQDQSFYFGKFLLVAPQWAKTRDVYLPAGEWFGLWDGQAYRGGQMIKDYAAPDDHIPVFVRAGAVIPMYPAMNYVGEKPPDPLTLDVWPGRQDAETSFELYEDDGTSYEFERGAYRVRMIRCKSTETGATVVLSDPTQKGWLPPSREGAGKRRKLVMRVHGPRPTDVRLDGRPLPADGWRYDVDKRVTAIETRETDGLQTLRVTWP